MVQEAYWREEILSYFLAQFVFHILSVVLPLAGAPVFKTQTSQSMILSPAKVNCLDFPLILSESLKVKDKIIILDMLKGRAF